jgi:hypothetical protein
VWKDQWEKKWEFRHEQNIVWAAGSTVMVAEINNEKRREVLREVKKVQGITDSDLEINQDVI